MDRAPESSSSKDFLREAEGPSRGFVGEFVDFLTDNKKWWLWPIVIALLLVSVLVILGGTSLAPFIYTLF